MTEKKNQKSILEQIKEGRMEVNHAGQTIPGVTLPRWLKDLDEETLFDTEKLVEYLKQHGVLYEVIHTGIQQSFVKMRAKFRKVKDGEQLALKADEIEKLKLEILDFIPTTIPKPLSQKDKIKALIQKTGLSKAEILEMLNE